MLIKKVAVEFYMGKVGISLPHWELMENTKMGSDVPGTLKHCQVTESKSTLLDDLT